MANRFKCLVALGVALAAILPETSDVYAQAPAQAVTFDGTLVVACYVSRVDRDMARRNGSDGPITSGPQLLIGIVPMAGDQDQNRSSTAVIHDPNNLANSNSVSEVIIENGAIAVLFGPSGEQGRSLALAPEPGNSSFFRAVLIPQTRDAQDLGYVGRCRTARVIEGLSPIDGLRRLPQSIVR